MPNTPTNQPTHQPTNTPPETMTFDISAGWNVLVFPALPDPHYDVHKLLADLAAQEGCPVGVYRWQGEVGNWAGHVYDLPFGNFPLRAGEPYFLNVTCPTTLRLPAGTPATPNEHIPLTPGWNFVALPPSSGTLSAEAACRQIADQGGVASEIARWNTDVGNWTSYICGESAGGFEMTPAEGYFIRSRVDSEWQPEAIMGGAREANKGGKW